MTESASLCAFFSPVTHISGTDTIVGLPSSSGETLKQIGDKVIT